MFCDVLWQLFVQSCSYQQSQRCASFLEEVGVPPRHIIHSLGDQLKHRDSWSVVIPQVSFQRKRACRARRARRSARAEFLRFERSPCLVARLAAAAGGTVRAISAASVARGCREVLNGVGCLGWDEANHPGVPCDSWFCQHVPTISLP